MRAILVEEYGGPEVLTAVDLPEPTPGFGEVLIQHEFVGVNFVDTQHRAGEPYPVELPLVPGIEAAGRIAAIGDGVVDFEVGERVAYGGPMAGVYAERAVLPEAQLLRVPARVDSDLAAAVLLQGMTAHVMTHDVYASNTETIALVHAAAGGTGSLIVQYLLIQGATVIASTSSDDKAAFLERMGAQYVVNYRQEDLVGRVHEIAPGGVDVVFDSVGKATFWSSIRSLRPKGTMVAFGQSSGSVPPVDIATLSGLTGDETPGSLWLTWPTLNDYNATPAERRRRAQELFHSVASGDLTPHVAGRYPLRDAAQSHRDLESRSIVGKLLLEIGQ